MLLPVIDLTTYWQENNYSSIQKNNMYTRFTVYSRGYKLIFIIQLLWHPVPWYPVRSSSLGPLHMLDISQVFQWTYIYLRNFAVFFIILQQHCLPAWFVILEIELFCLCLWGKTWAFLIVQLVKNHLQCRRPQFDPWVGKIPWSRARLPSPVRWPGEFYGLYSPWGCKESDTTERFSLSLRKI